MGKLGMARLIAAFIVIGMVSASARADERAQAREHYLKGTKAFDLGSYEEAVTEYMAAYRAKDDPALLYNIAQAHRLAGHASEALRFYKTYLARTPRVVNRAEVETKIAELQKAVDQQKKTQNNLPPDQPIKPPVTPSPIDETPAKPEPVPSPVVVQPPAATTKPIDLNAGRTKRIAGIATAAVGVACLATGIAFSLLAKSLSDELTALDHTKMGTFDNGKDQTGHTDDILGGVFLGIGAAAVVAGATVLALGIKDGRAVRRSRASFLPAFSPHGASATVQVSF